MEPVVVGDFRVGVTFTTRHIPADDAKRNQRIVRSTKTGNKRMYVAIPVVSQSVI